MEFRKADPNAMTLTKLKDQRRRDKVEYDMARFEHKQRSFPKFSDRADVPFWIDHDAVAADPGIAPAHPAMPRTLSEPVFKITETAHGDDTHPSHQELPESAYHTAAGLPAPQSLSKTVTHKTVGSKTKKSFCSEMIERGQARNQPRLFDAIQPLHTGPRDMESLDVTSSMAPIREAAYRQRIEDRKRNATNPRRSMLWSDMSGMANSSSEMNLKLPHGANDSGMMGSTDGITSTAARSQERSVSITQPPMRTAARVHHVSPDATMRGGTQTIVEAQKEPKTYGSTIMMRSLSDTGVRSGGFQRLDWPANHPQRPPEKPDKTRSKSERRGESREKKQDVSQQGSVQPL
jgi:hypothetical protein